MTAQTTKAAFLQLYKELKNRISGEDSEVLKIAFDEVIAKLENDETDYNMQQAIDEIKTKLEGLVSLDVVVELIENKIKNLNPTPEKSYLQTEKAVKDFARVLRNSTSGKDFARLWREHLHSVQNDIDPNGALLPAAVLQKITDNIGKGKVWPLLRHTGLRSIKIAFQKWADASVDNLDKRASGHQKGETKRAENMQLVPRTLAATEIYKYLPVDFSTVKNCDNEAILLDYIVDEISRAIAWELDRAVLVGDGRDAADPEKIDPEKIRPIINDELTVQLQTPAGETRTDLERAAVAVNNVETEGEIYVFVSKKTALNLRKYVSAEGATPRFDKLEDIAASIGAAGIVVVPNYLNDRIIAVDVNEYQTVGMSEHEFLTGYNIEKNQYQYEGVIMAGGALTAPKSAAVHR